MMKNKILKQALSLVALLMATALSLPVCAQVTMGTNKPPVGAAILQIKDKDPNDPENDNQTVTKGGLMLPRVALEDLKKLSPLVDDGDATYESQKELHIGTLVYNTTDDSSKQLYLGIYVWDGFTWSFMVSESTNAQLDVDQKELIFPSGHTPQPLNGQSITATWLPTSATCAMSARPLLGDGVSVSSALPNNVSGGTLTHLLTLNPMSAADIVKDRFMEKASTLTIVKSDAGNIQQVRIVVRQIHYNLVVEGLEKVADLGKTYTAKVKANTSWKAVATPDDGSILSSYTQTGGAGTIVGSDFSYSILNDDNIEGKSVKVTFYSTDANGDVDTKIAPVDITINTKKEYPNSYIVAPNGNFEFPVRKLYNVWKNEFGENLTGVVTAELVWQDATSLITAVNTIDGNQDIKAKISVDVANQKGNALIAVKVGGETKWHYHLWVTDYDPNDVLLPAPGFDEPTTTASATVTGGYVYGYYNSTKKTVFMDRYLGASSPSHGANGEGIAPVYQWGRSIPFVHLTGYQNGRNPRPMYDISNVRIPHWAKVATTVANNLKNAIQNPLNFYTGANDNDQDWYSATVDTHNDYLWSDKDGKKGIYDPCPVGWRVMHTGTGGDNPLFGISTTPPVGPDSKTSDFSANGIGYWALQPFIMQNGNMNDGESTAGIGTASPAAAHQYRMTIGQGGALVVGYARGFAYAVRCVRDDK